MRLPQTYFILAILVYTSSFVSAQCSLNTDCNYGLCEAGFCACYSGVTGPNCTEFTSNCSYSNVSALSTDNTPSLDTNFSKVLLGELRLKVISPLVYNRLSTVIYLADATLFPECAFDAWNKVITECREEYEFRMNWTSAVLCGWVQDSSTDSVRYANYIYVKVKDQVDVFRGTPILRETLHNFAVILRFETSVDVSAQMQIFAPVNLLAAISHQSYDPETKFGQLEFTTSLQWPFELANVTLGAAPVGVQISLNSIQLACPLASNTDCDQQFQLSISPGTACTLSGLYRLEFQVVCRGDEASCPLQAGIADAALTGLILSENFCSGLEIDIGLFATLSVYRDALYTSTKSDFFHGQTAYFRAELSTHLSASIVSSRITDIRLSDTSRTIALRLLGILTPAGQSAQLQDDPTATTYAPSFSLVPNSDIFPVPTESVEVFTITVIIEVEYVDGSKKRFETYERMRRQGFGGSQSADARVPLYVSRPALLPVGEPSSEDSSSNAAALSLLCAVALMAS